MAPGAVTESGVVQMISRILTFCHLWSWSYIFCTKWNDHFQKNTSYQKWSILQFDRYAYTSVFYTTTAQKQPTSSAYLVQVRKMKSKANWRLSFSLDALMISDFKRRERCLVVELKPDGLNVLLTLTKTTLLKGVPLLSSDTLLLEPILCPN